MSAPRVVMTLTEESAAQLVAGLNLSREGLQLLGNAVQNAKWRHDDARAKFSRPQTKSRACDEGWHSMCGACVCQCHKASAAADGSRVVR